MNWRRWIEPAGPHGSDAPPGPGFIRRHPWLSAGGLILALLLTNLSRVHDGMQRHGEIPLISLLVVAPLLWRKRAPMPAFLFSAAAAAVQWAITGPLFVDLALLICFYTVAATSSRRRTLIAAAILEFGVIIAVLKYGQGSYALAALLLTGLVVAAGMLGINIQVRRAYLAEMEAKAARLEYERDQQGRLAVAAERNRIAREMHDIVAHNLSVMIALNDGASFTMHSDPARAAEAVREASSVGRTALGELRRALSVLRAGDGGTMTSDDTPSRAPTPKIADLDPLLIPIRRTGLDVSLTIEGPVGQLSSGLQLAVFRLVQESLTNTVKHAVDARHASVTIRTGTLGTEVWVIDDGKALSAAAPRQLAPGSGQGIIGMHERAAGHGGRVETGRTATGWMVRAWFPLEAPTLPLQTPEPAGARW